MDNSVTKPYVDRVHEALSDVLDGFNRTPDGFRTLMQNPEYAQRAHYALSDNINGFNVPISDFHANVNPKPIKQFYENYIGSDVYKKRLSNFNNKDKPNVQNLLTTPITYNNGQGSNTNFGKIVDNDGAHIYPGTSKINIDPAEITRANKFYGANGTIESTLSHEFSHDSRILTPKEESFIASLNKNKVDNKVYSDYKKSKYTGTIGDFIDMNYDLNVASHDAKPDEIKADLDALRYSLWKKGIYDTSKRDMTIDDYNKAAKDNEINNSLGFKRLMERFNPQDIIKLNNTIASINYPNNNLPLA